jgi:transposase
MTLEEQAATLRPPEILALLGPQRELQEQNAALRRQVEWFQRQLFGRQSEKRLREPDPDQLSLAGMLTAPVSPTEQPPPPTETVKAYQRRLRCTGAEVAAESEVRFDSSVPVHAILLTNPDGADLPPEADEVLSEKGTSRLAPRPGA